MQEPTSLSTPLPFCRFRLPRPCLLRIYHTHTEHSEEVTAHPFKSSPLDATTPDSSTGVKLNVRVKYQDGEPEVGVEEEEASGETSHTYGTSACASAWEGNKGWLDRREAQEIAGPQGMKAPAETEVRLLSEFPSDPRMIIDLNSTL